MKGWNPLEASRGRFPFSAQIALSPATLLPIEIRDSQPLPADAHRGDVAAKAGGNVGVGGCPQQRVFLRCPGPPVRETDGDAQPLAAMCHRLPREAQPLRQLAVRHRAEQSVFPRRPLMEPGVELWNFQLNASALHPQARATQNFSKFLVWHRPHQLVLFTGVGPEMSARLAMVDRSGASKTRLVQLSCASRDVEFPAAMTDRFDRRPNKRRHLIVRTRRLLGRRSKRSVI